MTESTSYYEITCNMGNGSNPVQLISVLFLRRILFIGFGFYLAYYMYKQMLLTLCSLGTPKRAVFEVKTHQSLHCL